MWYWSYTCSHTAFLHVCPLYIGTICLLLLKAPVWPYIMGLHVNFILHGSCALGDGFHLNWGVLRAIHLRTLDNSSILVHVTNKFHETIHYHLLAVERKKNRLHKISFQNGKKAGTVLAWMYTFLLAMWSNQEANQGKLFTLKKINGLWL